MEDSDAAKAKLTEAKGKVWNLSCRVKQETYNVRVSFTIRQNSILLIFRNIHQDVTRPRYGINRAYAPDYARDGLHLLELVRKYPPSVNA